MAIVGGAVVQHAQRDLVTGQVLLQQAFEKGIQPFFGVVGDDREGDLGGGSVVCLLHWPRYFQLLGLSAKGLELQGWLFN